MNSKTTSTAPVRLGGGQAKQKLLAFASLIALILVFTVLKPDAFMTRDNIIGILQSTTSGSAFARLSDIGISQELGGNLSVDSTKFNAALAQRDAFENLFRVDNTGTTTDGVAVKFKTFADGLLAAGSGLFKTKEDSLKRALDQNAKDTERLNAKISRIEQQKRHRGIDQRNVGAADPFDRYAGGQQAARLGAGRVQKRHLDRRRRAGHAHRLPGHGARQHP